MQSARDLKHIKGSLENTGHKYTDNKTQHKSNTA